MIFFKERICFSIKGDNVGREMKAFMGKQRKGTVTCEEGVIPKRKRKGIGRPFHTRIHQPDIRFTFPIRTLRTTNEVLL